MDDNQVRFYTICSQSLESAKLGQYDDNSPAALRKNLEEQAKSFDINWGPASNTPFTMISPGVDAMNALIDQAVGYLEGYQASKVEAALKRK